MGVRGVKEGQRECDTQFSPPCVFGGGGPLFSHCGPSGWGAPAVGQWGNRLGGTA